MRRLEALELTGRVRSHIVQWEAPRFAAHPETVAAFLKMREAAKKEGFDLLPFSAFRDFQTQSRIWNMKFLGKKPLYDENGAIRESEGLSPAQRIDCILNWSAIPGGSRHHWGSEIDVVDAARMPPDYSVQLLPQEAAPGGIFHPLHQWLDAHVEDFGFFRPYREFQGGMFAEPWHLSHAAVARPALECLTLDILREAIESASLEGKALLLERLPEIYESHVLCICGN